MRTFTSLVMLVVCAYSVLAQGLNRISMDKGQRFIAAFAPYVQQSSEYPLPQPFKIVATSEFEANVRVRTMDPNGTVRIDTLIRIVPQGGTGGVATLSVPMSLVVSQSKRKARVALEVTSDVPITVTTRRTWAGSGEEAHILPADHLGTTYRVLAMPSDVYGLTPLTWVPGFIAVIGTVDGTSVTVRSHLPLIDPTTGLVLSANTSHTVMVDAGDVVMFDHTVDTNKVHTAAQDLSGTLVTADHPIGVLSGHLKGSVLTRQRVLPPTGVFKAPAHFVRNNLVEMLPPTTMADTVFVVTPFLYTSVRASGWRHHDSSDCMVLGDVVTIVATTDNTSVYKQRDGESSRKLIGTIQAGKALRDSSLFESAVYTSSHPVIVAQYGRSYGKTAKFVVGRDGGEQTQGHPTIEAGLPSMTMVVPENRWVTSAVWATVPNNDNFWSVVFRSGEEAFLTVNGSPVTQFGESVRIVGTPYSRISSMLPHSDKAYAVRATKNDVRFSVHSQCSLDGTQMGSAMAHHTGFDNPAPGKDSIIIADGMMTRDAALCGAYAATARVEGPNGITSVFASDRTNYTLTVNGFSTGDKSASFSVAPTDPSKAGHVVVRIVVASGSIAERRYDYEPKYLTFTMTNIPSRIGIRVPQCFDVTIINPNTEALLVHGLSMRMGGLLTVSEALPLTIEPSSSRTVTCCLSPATVGTFKDTLIMQRECFVQSGPDVQYTVAEAMIAVDDALFGRVDPAVQPITQNIRIRNLSGNVNLLVTDIRWAQGASDSHFRFDTTGLGLPVILALNEGVTLPVTYEPDGDTGVHNATICVKSSSSWSDSLIHCTAEARVVSSVEETPLPIDLHPVPVTLGGTLRATLPPSSQVRVLDVNGRLIEETATGEDGVLAIKITSDRYARGSYTLLVSNGRSTSSYRWIVE